MRIIKFAAKGQEHFRELTVEEFRTATGVQYAPELQFENENVLKNVRQQCSRAMEMGTITAQSQWLGTLHAEQLRNHFVADVSIHWIDETIGYGLFAEKEIQPGEFIGEYTGMVRRRTFLSDNINEYCFRYPAFVFSFKKHMIDARDWGNELSFGNHSETPNSETMGVWCDGLMHIIIRAIQVIPPSTEITYDYTGRQKFWRELSEFNIRKQVVSWFRKRYGIR